MKFIFLGPPGAGKGTLAAKVAVSFGIPHISTGEIFRAAIKAKTPLGLKVQAIIDSGSLVGDDITVELVKDRLAQSDAAGGFILDGFPRTIPQAQALEKIMGVDAVVNFDISDEGVIERLSGRRVCRRCARNYHVSFMPPKKDGVCDDCGGELYTRDDDKIEAISHRLEVYRSQTAPLIDFYRAKGLLADIDARPATEQILAEFDSKFKK
ncbi:MAG: adenylate kinase [Bacteroides sp.]|nr:adenylate kinase [Prevotella sp.]MCM1408427.1 adenylate kinase [Treponema brennaborense]MCM1469411.1 adenylate kinase [Bacteroides sp.]